MSEEDEEVQVVRKPRKQQKKKVPLEGGEVEVAEEKLGEILLSHSQAVKLMKKPKTEKQQAAFERMKLIRAQKLEEKKKLQEQEKAQQEKEEQEKMEQIKSLEKQCKPKKITMLVKPKGVNIKRKVKVEVQKSQDSSSDEDTTETSDTTETEPEVRKARKTVKKVSAIQQRLQQLKSTAAITPQQPNPFAHAFSKW